MADLLYAAEKFGSGRSILATHPGRVQQRVAEACGRQISMVWHEPTLDGVPSDVLQRIHDLAATATAIPHQSKGAINATLEQMSDDDAVQLARDIDSLTYELAELVDVKLGRK